MKQEIRFCTASDGVGIAYALAGSGTPLVKTANWLNHLEFDWESPIWRPVLEPLARRHLLLRYDERGNGLSDWDAPELTFEAFVRDLETVVDAAELERFSLFGISQGCAVSIAYAIRHPERVDRLVLYGGYARGWRQRGNPEEIEQRQAIHTLMAKGWGRDNPAFRHIFTSLFVPGATHEQMKWFNDLQRVSTSAENAVRLSNAFSEIDVLDLLPEVRIPTLVLHSRRDASVPFEAGRVLATRIPGARFVPLDSENHLILGQEPAWERYITEILSFLGSPQPDVTEEDRAAANPPRDTRPADPPSSWAEADRLLDRALDVPLEERPAWLEAATGSNRELRERVERLLAAVAEDDALDTGAAMTGALWEEVTEKLGDDVSLGEGDRLGAYTIVAPLGRGGMGTVYRARHDGLDREVAIKALSDVFAVDSASRRRFEREAKLLGRLNHPNIATVHDLLFIGDRPYLVMELVEGPTLAERLEAGPLESAEVITIADQLAEALEEAHGDGIVHRDLKPANVKLTASGRVKVLDFGLAKSIATLQESSAPSSYESSQTTRTGILLGTPGYMSPEQARAEKVDARADLWAFGCILYEMSTGERAFAGSNISDAIASVLRDDVDWTRVPETIPPELVALMKRCLEKDPAARAPDIHEVRARLSAMKAPVASPRSSPIPWAWVVVALGVAALLAFVITSLLD